tara:strand:+ start:733 stop:1743 length:1011 start_codon:yes stop_codon:yes gene_type:complete
MIKSPYKINKNFSKLNPFSKKNLLNIYHKLYFSRFVEEVIQNEYPNQQMKTPTHLGIGQEAISVGVCLNLKKKDAIFSHHRSHLPYISSDGSIYKLFCELLGKKNGSSGGKGGSVHLCSRSNGFYGSTAILGQAIGLAAGAGLAFKLKKKKNISVAFFGNSSLEEGLSFETLNFCSLKNIPTLFVYENNFYSTEMPNYKGDMKNFNPQKIVKGLGIKYLKVDGNNISDVFFKSKYAIDYIKKNSRPVFIEFITYRWLEHCGPYYDYALKRYYRTKKEVMYWKKFCPVASFKKFLIKKGFNKDISLLEKKINKKVNLIYKKALKSKKPILKDLQTNV